MKKVFRNISLVFLLVLMVTSTLGKTTVFASESNETNQVKTTITTDKNSYKQGDSAVITITVENKNQEKINDVNVNVNLPNSLKLSEGNTKVNFSNIDANSNEEIVIKAECVGENTLEVIATGDNTSAGGWIIVLLVSVAMILMVLLLRKKRNRWKGFLSLVLCITLASSNLMITEAASVKKSTNVDKSVDVNGQKVNIAVKVEFTVEEESAIVEENGSIKIDVSQFSYNEKDDVYILSDKTDKLTGTMKNVEDIVSAAYEIADLKGNILCEGEIEPAAKWSVSDIGYLVGENHIQVNAVDEDGIIYRDEIVLFNTIEENMSQLDIDREDTDEDGVLNYIEDINGTDKDKIDTDGDGLTDYDEIAILGTNPLEKDTDNNGVPDGDEDFDGDTLSNYDEIQKGLNPLSKDSDYEGLQDNIELEIGTDPLKADTDGDGINDYDEYQRGTDPLTPEDPQEIIEEVIDSDDMAIVGADVTPTLEIEASREALESLEVSVVSNGYINRALPGYIGEAYDFTMDGTFQSATLSMKFDEDLLNMEGFNPVIYYFNSDTKELEELPTEVSGNVATATLQHFSTYILLNKTAFDEVWNTEIRPPEYTGDDQKSGLDVVLAIDSSGSMSNNDGNGLRKDAAKLFVERLGDTDRAAIVDFDSNASELIGLTNDKAQLATAIDQIDSNGNTNLSRAISTSIDILTDDEASDLKYKYIILLTDGNGSYNNSYSQTAVENDIQIFTIGLGSGVDENLLKSIAEDTGGNYYFASSAEDLLGIYETTAGETIDYVTDSNNDGISDYYTKLLADGQLRVSSGLRVFGIASYEDIQANADYDGDGLKNGEEIEISRSSDGTKIYALMKSSPINVNSDHDQYGDYVEVNEYNTDPMEADVWIDQDQLADLQNDSNYVSNKYKEFYDGMITGALEKGSIWIGTHIFGTDYDHSMLYKEQFSDYFEILKDGYTSEGEDSLALDFTTDLSSQILSLISAYADGYVDYLGIPKDSAAKLKELQQKALDLDKMRLNASGTGFANKDDFYEYADDLYKQYQSATAEITDFKADLKLSANLKTVSKIADGVGFVLVAVDIVNSWKDIYDGYIQFVNQMDIMQQNIYIYDAIINGNADEDVKAAAADIRSVLQQDLEDSTQKIWDELGYDKQIKTSTLGKLSHSLAGLVPYVKYAELVISITDFCFNLSGVSKECLKLNGIATTANVLADDYGNYSNAQEQLYKFINLIYARMEAERQMQDAVNENTWITEWIFKYIMYKEEDTMANINYLSGIIPLYLIQLESL